MGQRRRNEILPRYAAPGRLLEAPMEVGDRDARRALKADSPLARKGHRMKLQGPDMRPLENKFEELGDLHVVQAHGDGG